MMYAPYNGKVSFVISFEIVMTSGCNLQINTKYINSHRMVGLYNIVFILLYSIV